MQPHPEPTVHLQQSVLASQSAFTLAEHPHAEVVGQLEVGVGSLSGLHETVMIMYKIKVKSAV